MTDQHQADKSPVIAVLAGEHSGDLLGAGLLKSLRTTYPHASFIGVGGPLMQAEGLHSLVPMDDLAVMGLAEVITHLPRLLAHRKHIVQQLTQAKPDIFIGIDAPDFNLPIARRLKALGITTMHYVSPSVWAWRQGRIKGIKKSVDHMLCLLPFEKAFYDEHGLPATFVGHPLADDSPMAWSKADARTELGIAQQAKVVGLLPGSRAGEIARMGPVFLQTAQRLWQQNPQLSFLVPMISAARQAQFAELQARLAPELPVTLIDGQARTVMAASDVLLLTSGTVTLEALLIKRPMVVAYRFSWLSYQLMKRLFKAAYFSLPNLLAGKAIVPELKQEETQPERLAAELTQLLEVPPPQLHEQFSAIHEQLRCNASTLAAQVVIDHLSKK